MPLRFAPLSDHPEHVPLIAGWFCEAWGLPEPFPTLQEYEQSLAQSLPGALPFNLLAFDAESLVAVARLKDTTTLQERFPTFQHWLSAVYVAPYARGRGVASALCRELIAHAVSRGITSLYLTTEALDGGLYARLGWKPVERISLDGIDTLIMGLELAAETSDFRRG